MVPVRTLPDKQADTSDVLYLCRVDFHKNIQKWIKLSKGNTFDIIDRLTVGDVYVWAVTVNVSLQVCLHGFFVSVFLSSGFISERMKFCRYNILVYPNPLAGPLAQ